MEMTPRTHPDPGHKAESNGSSRHDNMAHSIPRINVNKRDRLRWCTPELEDAKAYIKKLENQSFNMKDQRRDLKREIRKDARYNYRTLIRREKYLAFRKLVNNTNYSSAINQEKYFDERIGQLTKPAGSTCKSRYS
jgi:hypothetical protein